MDSNNQEIIDELVDEGMISLDAARQLLCIQGVKSGDDVDSLFRVLHTIKGNASMMGLQAVARLSHQIEEVLDEWRKNRIGPSLLLFHTLEAAVDCLLPEREKARLLL